MRRDAKTEREKELLKLNREYANLWKAKYSGEAGHYVELEEPYQQGWERYFVLRDDAKNRRDAHVLNKLLDILNVTIHCHRRDFMTKDWRTGKWVPITQTIKTLDVGSWKKLNERERSYFSGSWECVGKDWHTKEKRWEFRYHFHYPEYFVFRVEPLYVTHQWIPNSDWETKHAELYHYICNNNLWPKINKALGIPTHFERDYYWNPARLRHKYGEYLDEGWDLDDMAA
jgi:hypothetical protein